MLEGHFDSLVFMIGVAAVAYPLWAAWYFRKTTSLGKASSFMYLSESFSMLMTLGFTFAAMHDMLSSDNEHFHMVVRLLMFVFALASSYNLHRVIRSINGRKP